MRTQIDIDGNRWCLLKTPDINIHLSIDQSIDISTEGQSGGRDTSEVHQEALSGYIERTNQQDGRLKEQT